LSIDCPIFTVPYLTEEAGREYPCTSEMERAAILCLSEAKRKKGGFLSGAEKISCIARLYYPFWIVPWNDKCVVVDGLDIISSNIRHYEAPDVLEFTEALRRSSSSPKPFINTLKRHIQTFQKFKSSRKVAFRGIIFDESLLRSFSSILNEAEEVEADDRSRLPFAPTLISREEAEDRSKHLIEEWNLLNDEVESLHYAIEVLNLESEHHKEKISIEINEIRREYDERISKTRKLVDKSIKGLTREMEREKSRVERDFRRRLDRLERERSRVEDRIETLSISLRRAVEARRRQKSRYPKRSTTRIDSRISKYRDNIQVLKRRLTELKRMEDDARREMQRRIREIEEKYQGAINEELEKLRVLEEARRRELSEKSELISQIDQLSSSIESHIRGLMERKADEMESLERRALPFRFEGTSLVGIPFYMSVFESSRRVRVEVYPPMIAKAYKGLLQRIKRVFFSFSLESRIGLLLNQRYPDLSKEVFFKVKDIISSNISFKSRILEVGRANNLLNSPDFANSIVKGVVELEREGWINGDEAHRLIRMYAGG